MPAMFGTTLTTSSTHGTCGSTTYQAGVDRFLRFYAIAGNAYEISSCSNVANTELYVTTHNSSPVVLRCDLDGCGSTDGPASLSFIPITSGDYRIYFFDGACGNTFPAGSQLEIVINCTPAPVPVNDLPCNAISLTVNGSTCEMVEGSNIGATNAQATITGIGAAPDCAGAGFQTGDVWFTAQVPASGYLGIRTEEASLCAGAFQLYTATVCDGTFTKLANGCIITGYTGPNSEPAVIFDAVAAGLSPGSTIYIRYWERNGNEQGSFGICAFDPEFASNDEACSATSIVFGHICQPVQVQAYHATSSTIPEPSCASIPEINDLWFEMELPDPFPVEIQSFSVQVSDQFEGDLGMAWYHLPDPCSDAGAQLIACSSSGSINSSLVPPGTIAPGQTIHIRVWGQNSFANAFSICSSYEMLPDNGQFSSADCLGAIPLCNNATYQPSYETGTPEDEINSLSAGCLSAWLSESESVWLTLSFGPNTIPCSPIAFDLVLGSRTEYLFDFVIWGPFPAGSVPSTICPIDQAPYRCNSSITHDKGLEYDNSLPAYASGPPKARHMVVNPGDVFLLFVSNWVQSGDEFQIVFKTPDPNFQVMASDCSPGNIPAPHGSYAQLGCNVSLPVNVVLGGAYNEGDELMDDDLRQLGLLPLTEPFTALGYPQAGHSGGETATPDLFTIAGPEAVVDWVRLELRSSLDPEALVSATHALLCRNSTIVTADGSPYVTFIAEPGEYHLVVRHRNHLGIMTASPMVLTTANNTLDLGSFTTQVFGMDARKDMSGKAALWPGNANGDDRVKYTGVDNDRDVILQAIGAVVPTAVVNGYMGADLNLDGDVKYTGPGNDRDIILQTIGGQIPTAIKVDGIPGP